MSSDEVYQIFREEDFEKFKASLQELTSHESEDLFFSLTNFIMKVEKERKNCDWAYKFVEQMLEKKTICPKTLVSYIVDFFYDDFENKSTDLSELICEYIDDTSLISGIPNDFDCIYVAFNDPSVKWSVYQSLLSTVERNQCKKVANLESEVKQLQLEMNQMKEKLKMYEDVDRPELDDDDDQPQPEPEPESEPEPEPELEPELELGDDNNQPQPDEDDDDNEDDDNNNDEENQLQPGPESELDDDNGEEDTLTKMTKTQLVKLAKEKGYKKYSRLSKVHLIHFILKGGILN